jgi:hypothetical protein
MVPVVEEPPGRSFTVQVTAVLVEPVTLAEKRTDAARLREGFFGAMVTATVGAGGFGGGDCVEDPPPLDAQPARSGSRQSSWKSRGRMWVQVWKGSAEGTTVRGDRKRAEVVRMVERRRLKINS